jgi:hypothetical protein
MTAEQEIKFKMYLAIKDFLASRLTLLTPLPNFEMAYKIFVNSITGIQNHAEQESLDKAGIISNNKELKQSLSLITDDIARKLRAFALFMNDQVLLIEARFSPNDPEHDPDSLLVEKARVIYEQAEHHISGLTPYGIKSETLLEFKKAIDTFFSSMPVPQQISTPSKTITIQPPDYFRSADESLQYIDALIDIIRIPEPNFSIAYKQLRKTVVYKTQSVALKGVVTDAETQAPIKGVTISLVRKDSSVGQPAIIKNSAAKGDFNVTSLEEGIYDVILNKGGYKEMVITSILNKGQLNEINVNMARG